MRKIGENMKKIFCGILSAALIFSCFAETVIAKQGTAKVYVTFHGDDSKDGTQINSAVKTIGRAQEIARIYAAEGRRTEVILEGGVYELDSEISFTAADSGASAEAPVIYRSYMGQRAVLTRGRHIEAESFSPTGNTAVPLEARNNVYEADLSDFGTLAGGISDVLFAEDKVRQPAKWPNSGYAYMTKYSETDEEGNTVSGISIPNGKKGAWTGLSDMYFGYWNNGYTYYIHRITNAADDYLQPGGNNAYSCVVMNVLCELDSPGEYYIDTAAKKLYYYPENGLDSVYLASASGNVVSMNGAQNIRFENVDMICARGEGFHLENCKNIVIYGSEIRGLGSYGINASNTSGLLVCECDISELNANGVNISGGKQVTLTPSGNIIRNSYVHDFAKLKKAGSTGINLGGVGAAVSHCEVYNAPHQGITFAGNDHIIEYNRIYNVMKESSDSGAIYCGRSWTERGSVIRNNYIYNTKDVADYTYNDGNEYWGGTDRDAIYCDDLQSGITVSGNIIYNMGRAYIFGGGSDNKLIDNIAIDCRRGVEYDRQGERGWRYQHIDPNGTAGKNIYKQITALINNSEYNSELWYSRYPKFRDVIERKEAFDRDMAMENTTNQFKEDAKTRWGYVYDRVVHNNYYTGVRADDYAANGFYSGEYKGENPVSSSKKSWSYLGRFPNERYVLDNIPVASVDGMAAGVGEHENANIILSREELGVSVADNYDITISGSGLSEGVSRSTADMGVEAEDGYIPSYSENEFDVNAGNKFKAYAAVYDNSGRLHEVKVFDEVYIYDGQEIELESDIPDGAADGWYMEIYMWSADGKMKPVAKKTFVLGGNT